jgi:hypothetical protein
MAGHDAVSRFSALLVGGIVVGGVEALPVVPIPEVLHLTRVRDAMITGLARIPSVLC